MFEQRREIILLAGMHRCGTSALARLLNLCGAVIPGSLLPASAHNPRGYWESTEVLQINNRALQSAGLEWNAVFEIEAGWYDTLPGRAFLAEAKRFATELDSSHRLLLIKDPRFSLLATGWRQALEAAGFLVKIIIAYRDPAEVAQSLASRQLLYVPHEAWPPERSHAIWINYLLSAERTSRGGHRTFVDYGLVMNDWRSALSQINSDLELRGQLRYEGVEQEIDTFLSKDLRNARTGGVYEDGYIVAQVLALMKAASAQPHGLEDDFDTAHQVFSQMRKMFGTFAAELQRKNEALAGQKLRSSSSTAAMTTSHHSVDVTESDDGLQVRHAALLNAYLDLGGSLTRERKDAAIAAERLRHQAAAMEARTAKLESDLQELQEQLSLQVLKHDMERNGLEEQLRIQTSRQDAERYALDERLRVSEAQAANDLLEAAKAAATALANERFFLNVNAAAEASHLREQIVFTRLQTRLSMEEEWRRERASLLTNQQFRIEAMTTEISGTDAICERMSEALAASDRLLSDLRRELDVHARAAEAGHGLSLAAQQQAEAELRGVLRSKSWQMTRPLRALRRRLQS